MALLEIRHVTRCFGDFVALRDVSLAVEAGEFFTLLGPSGCGKTTLLRLIAGFDEPDEGALFLDGQPLAGIPPERRPVHTVFQSYALFPHMTVAENVAFPLRMARRPAAEIRQRLAQTLALVHLEDKGQAYPDALSGGQKQRVALARGLINKPRLLLLDEPLGALDAKLRERMQGELVALQRNVGVTFVFVTHAQVEALALSHRIAVMNEGRIEQLDSPARLYAYPESRFVADFIGISNLLEARVLAVEADGLRLTVPGLGEIRAGPADGVRPGQAGALSLRPEQIRLTHHGEAATLPNHFGGRVAERLYRGDVTLFKVRLDGGATLETLVANDSPGEARGFAVGEPVAVAWRADAGLFLGD